MVVSTASSGAFSSNVFASEFLVTKCFLLLRVSFTFLIGVMHLFQAFPWRYRDTGKEHIDFLVLLSIANMFFPRMTPDLGRIIFTVLQRLEYIYERQHSRCIF